MKAIGCQTGNAVLDPLDRAETSHSSFPIHEYCAGNMQTKPKHPDYSLIRVTDDSANESRWIPLYSYLQTSSYLELIVA